jgi:hypothetical protein
MSFQTISVSCTGCQFVGGIQVRPIKVVYLTDEGREVEGGRTRGWCHSCNAIVNIESRPDLKELAETVTALSRVIKERKRAISRLWKRRQIVSEEEQLQHLEAEIGLWKNRSTGPRCLTCQSEGVEELQFAENGLSRNFTHECGKQLRVHKIDPEAPRFSYAPKTIYLDSQGRLVEHD